jgi:hypothetical protein
MIIQKNEMGWACGTYGRKETSACRVFVVKPEERRPLVRPRRRWEDTIKVDLQKIGLDLCGSGYRKVVSCS